MDKNTGDQLNRAYEAYRQACIEKDTARRELQQKKELYEQQLHDQHRQIVSLKRCVALLTSQLSSFTAAGGAPFPPMSPKLENAEGSNIEGDSIEQLQEQLRASAQRERNYKEQLERERLKVQELERKQLCMQQCHNEDILRLKHLLKNGNERKNSSPSQEMEVRSANINQEPPSAAAHAPENSRQDAERVFWDLKEEFNRICNLTREQSSQLNKFFKQDHAADNHVHMQFSMPVQCTDEENEEAQAMEKPHDKTIRSQLLPITPRGLGMDNDLSTSVESLSTFSVKFPPSSNELEFLESSTENLPVIIPARAENMNGTKINTEVPHHKKNFNGARCSPPYSPHSPKTVCTLDDQNPSDLDSNYIGKFAAEVDNGLFLTDGSLDGTSTNNLCGADIPAMSEATERQTVRGPQRPVWKPVSHDGDSLLAASAEKWDRSDVCEFCQAVFPPSTQSDEFLRHLSTHFGKP